MRCDQSVLLSLGSNLGDRLTYLRDAIRALDALKTVAVKVVSHCYETAPVGKTDQPAFMNLAVEIETVLEPLELLDTVKEIERGLGRKPAERWGPRVIDIDIILWGQRTLEEDRLTLPHREFRNRAFVLMPLAEIAPDGVDPVTGATVAELAQRPEARGTVMRLDDVGVILPTST